jgi:hypothetical protein
MKNIFICIAIILSVNLPSCSSTKNVSSSSSKSNLQQLAIQDGSSFEKAIIIHENTESKGIKSEYYWLSVHYPGYKVKLQAISQHNKKPFDILTVFTNDGKEISIYFDISNFYGKF